MSRIRLTLALIAAAGLTCGTVFAQMSQPATNAPARSMDNKDLFHLEHALLP